MSCQWNALTVNVIKTRKIECAKLQLPATLAKSPIKSTASPKLAPTSTEKFNSSGEKSNEASHESHSSIIDSIIPLLSPEDSLNSSTYTEDEVFQESFETPPEIDGIFNKSATKRCISLPSYLTFEERYSYSKEFGDRFRPRRLFEEALNLESYSGSSRGNRVESGEFSDDWSDETFPRLQEHILKRNASGTPHAERMKKSKSSSQINCDNNNNVRYDQNHLQGTKNDFVTKSKERFDVRDWEQKVLVLTSDYEFGTESSNRPRDEIDARSRSVALTENISTFASDKIRKDQNTQRQVKSATRSEMPKLQTVVWDFIKRRSTKKKRKNDSNRLEQNENLKEENLKETNQESSSVTERRKSKDQLPHKVKRFEADTSLKPDQNNAEITPGISRKSRNIKSWKSDPNLSLYRHDGNIKIRRFNSHNILPPGSDKFPRKLPAMELQMNSDTLTFMLTAVPEEKSIEERMMTLKMSREWLLKELKSMREQDRKLARQFIHLRSAIVEMKEYCDREDSECDSECEFGTQEMLHKNHKRNEISKERKIQIHNTPAINILSYC